MAPFPPDVSFVSETQFCGSAFGEISLLWANLQVIWVNIDVSDDFEWDFVYINQWNTREFPKERNGV